MNNDIQSRIAAALALDPIKAVTQLVELRKELGEDHPEAAMITSHIDRLCDRVISGK